MKRPVYAPTYTTFRAAATCASALLIASVVALPGAAPVADTPDGGVVTEVSVSWATDAAEPDASVVAKTRAAKAQPGQKKPPCTPKVQMELDGVCWVVTIATPPCPDDTAEGAGRCLVPVAPAPRTPTSLDP